MSAHNLTENHNGKAASVDPFKTPVLFLIFNRPGTTKKVFDAIRKSRPSKLYVAADGPRATHPEDQERCERARAIATDVDWECEVHTLFRDENLGCGRGPSSAITWFFEHEAEGIILEDDCIPSPSFFIYCAELLRRYRHDTRIMHIAGTNLARPDLRDRQYSYSFSNFTYCWGWATWRRAWKYHDFDMSLYGEVSGKKYLDLHYRSIYERDYFRYVFEKMHNGDRRNVWDYQWQFACRINSGLVIVPENNMIVNVGLGGDATNTLHAKGIGHNLMQEQIAFPLRHPQFVMVNQKWENETFRMNLTSPKTRVKTAIKQVVPKSIIDKLKTSVWGILSEKQKAVQHNGTY